MPLGSLGLLADSALALAKGKPAAMDAVARVVHRFERVAVAPYWAAMTAAAAMAAAAWSRVISSGGVERFLLSLHPAHRLPYIIINNSGLYRCPPTCPHRVVWRAGSKTNINRVGPGGLIIRPSLLGTAIGIWSNSVAGEVCGLSVPVAVPSNVLRVTYPTPASEPLAQLLGSTRSWVLAACVDTELTTTGLAQMVGISNSSASEHAAVLRSAGLVESHRTERTVVHRASPLGILLVQNTLTTAPAAPSWSG